MYYKALFIFIFISLNFYSQLNYINYHSKTSEAEDLILDKKYREAFYKYDSVFMVYPKHFSKDLFNAAVCAQRVKNKKKTQAYLMEMVDLGINPKYFFSPTFFHLKISKGGIKFKKELIKRYKEAQELKKRDSITLFIDSLFKIDQKYRLMEDGYTVFKDSISKIDSLNTIEILKILSTRGYLTEKESFDVDKPSELSSFYYILLHVYILNEANQNSSIISKILLEQVKEGNLLPQTYAELEDRKDNDLMRESCFGTLAYLIIQNRKVELQTNLYEINCIDKNRQSIGLENYTNYKRKLNYYRPIFNPLCFYNNWGIVHLSGIRYKDFIKYAR